MLRGGINAPALRVQADEFVETHSPGHLAAHLA